MSIEANIQSAIADLKSEPDALAEIAAEYGIKPEVLAARFARAYPNGVPAEIDMAAKVEDEIVRQCARYSTTREGVIGPVKAVNGRRVYCIGRHDREVIAVCADTAKTWRMGVGNFTDAQMRYQGIVA